MTVIVMAPVGGSEASDEAQCATTNMLSFCQVGIQRKSQLFTKALLLLFYQHFSDQNHNRSRLDSIYTKSEIW